MMSNRNDFLIFWDVRFPMAPVSPGLEFLLAVITMTSSKIWKMKAERCGLATMERSFAEVKDRRRRRRPSGFPQGFNFQGHPPIADAEVDGPLRRLTSASAMRPSSARSPWRRRRRHWKCKGHGLHLNDWPHLHITFIIVHRPHYQLELLIEFGEKKVVQLTMASFV